MKRSKIIFSILFATIFLATQFMVVGAAPATQETTPVSGTIQSITLETDPETDITTVVVTLTDETGEVTVTLSIEEAIGIGLVTDNGTGPSVDNSKIGTVYPEITTEEEAQHPVGSALSDFFTELLGVNYETIMTYHNEEGVGFGVIAQALWMTNTLNKAGDTELTPEQLATMFRNILDAKKNKNFTELGEELGITLPDGSYPQNWGQFRKAVMSDREKAKNNLGYIMSGRASEDQTEDGLVEPKNNGKGLDKDKSDNGKNDNKGNGKDKNKDKGNGKNK